MEPAYQPTVLNIRHLCLQHYIREHLGEGGANSIPQESSVKSQAMAASHPRLGGTGRQLREAASPEPSES